MQYLLMIYEEESRSAGMGKAEWDAETAEYIVFGKENAKAILGGNALQPTSVATTVRVRNGKTLTTDGPFAETKEQLAGYYMLECKDLDDAIEWAKRIPTGCKGAVGCIEIRPVHELSRRP
jgi:hypothetical protein